MRNRKSLQLLNVRASVSLPPPRHPPKSFNNSNTSSVYHGELKVAGKSWLEAAPLVRCAELGAMTVNLLV